MIEMRDFLPGITRLAVAARQAVDEATFEVYREALGLDVDAQAWEAFTLDSVRRDRFPTWFPRVSEIRDALREWRGETPLNVEAVAAYERVLASGTYSAEGGTSWDYRTVAEKCGKVAAQAFLAAGGHNAFVNTDRFGDEKRRRAFCEEYVAAAREVPEGRMLTSTERTMLEAAK